jgi:hypothetical protein
MNRFYHFWVPRVIEELRQMDPSLLVLLSKDRLSIQPKTESTKNLYSEAQ